MPHLGPFVSGEHPTFAGISKVDLLAEDEGSALAGQIPFPQGFEGGEAYFVPTDKLANEHSAGAHIAVCYNVPQPSVVACMLNHSVKIITSPSDQCSWQHSAAAEFSKSYGV